MALVRWGWRWFKTGAWMGSRNPRYNVVTLTLSPQKFESLDSLVVSKVDRLFQIQEMKAHQSTLSYFLQGQ